MLPKRVFIGVLFFCVMMTACGGFFSDEQGDGGTTTKTGKFVFVANFTSGLQGTVASFLMNPNSGALTPATGSPFQAATGPTTVGSDAEGKFVYVANQEGVTAYLVGRNDGTLATIQGSPFPAGTNPVALAVDPGARFVYTVNKGSGNITGYTVSTSTGALVPFASPIGAGAAPVGIAEHPNGRFLYVAGGTAGTFVFRINTDGSLTAVRTVPSSPCGSASAVIVDPLGDFAYVADAANGICLYAINPSSGDLIPISSAIFPTGPKPTAMAATPDGKFLYVADQTANEIAGYTVNADGTLTAVSGSPFNAGGAPLSISVDPASKFVYAVSSTGGIVTVFTIGSGGALTSAGTTSTGLTEPVSVVVTP